MTGTGHLKRQERPAHVRLPKKKTSTSGRTVHALRELHSLLPSRSTDEYRPAFSQACSSRLSTSPLATRTARRFRRNTFPVHGATCTPSAMTWRTSALCFTFLHLRPRRQQRSCCVLQVWRLPSTEASGFFPVSSEPIFSQLSTFGAFFRLVLAETLVLPEATEDSSAAPAWRRGAQSQDHGSAQQTQSGLVLLGLSVSTCRGCCSELLSVRDTFPLPTRPRSDGRSTLGLPSRMSGRARGCAGREVDCGKGRSCSLRTRGHPTVTRRWRLLKHVYMWTAARDRWQAAETSRRRAVLARKKSAEALHKAQRESHEVLDNVLKSAEDI